jgi:cytoskeletal protein CcmA (bactofilin family)
MMRLHALVFALIALTAGTPAAAALKGFGPFDENPRASWFERFQESRQGPEQTDRFTGTYKVDPQGTLDLTHVSGDVRVTTGLGNEVRLEAIKRVRHRNAEEGKRLLNALRVDVSQAGGRLEVRTIYPRLPGNRGFNGTVDYTIVVPQTLAVSLKTVSGDVTVHGVRGEVRAETVSGDVEVVSTPNLAVAKSVSGDVNARDIAASTLTLGTVSGTVIATALKVRTLEAGSVSGDVQLSNLQVERLSAKSFSGSIAFDGNLQRSTRYEFTSHSGDVRVSLPGNTSGFELDASTFSGSVRSDFPVVLRPIGREDRRPASTRAMRGTFGDAGAILAVRSFSGSVVIVKK